MASSSITSRQIRRESRRFELSRDIDRNRDDALFSRGQDLLRSPTAREILYVLDTNILRFFLSPQDEPEHSETYYSALFDMDGVSPARANSYCAQSALITAEYLFSGELPGQRNGRLYLSEWHYRELKPVLEGYRQSLERDRHAQSISKSAGVEVASSDLLQFLRRVDAGAYVKELIGDDDILRDDVQRIRFPNAEREERKFVVARRFAAFLENPTLVNRYYQLARFYGSEAMGRVTPLHRRFQPKTTQDFESIIAGRNFWFDLLTAESARYPKDREVVDPSTERDLLSNDARTLAYLSWIAETRLAPDKERICFITTDRTLFDAYRRWHVKQPGGIPFLLRRPSQFAPIFNFRDMKSDVSQRMMFEKTRLAVEGELLRLRGIFVNTTERERFCLSLSDAARAPDPVVAAKDLLSYDDVRPDRPRIDQDPEELITTWRQIERVGIGACLNLIERRFDSAQRALAESLERVDPGRIGEILGSYLASLTDTIFKANVQLWSPLASDFIFAGKDREQFTDREVARRVPIALYLRVPDVALRHEERNYTIIDFIKRWQDGEERYAELLSPSNNASLAAKPSMVFAIAAVLALRMQFWKDAVRFADLAEEAAKLGHDATMEVDDDFYEYRFLRGLTRRFRMGDNKTPLDAKPRAVQTVLGSIRQLGGEASRCLKDCITYHRRRKQPLRELRAKSELAAVKLTVATWVAVWFDLLGDRDRRWADSEIGDAIVELRQCIRRDAEFVDDPNAPHRQSIFSRIQSQYYINYCYTTLLSMYFDVVHGRQQGIQERDEKLAAQVLVRAKEYVADRPFFEDFPAVGKLDLLLYLKLVGSVSGLDAQIQEVVADATNRKMMPFDSELMRMFQALNARCSESTIP